MLHVLHISRASSRKFRAIHFFIRASFVSYRLFYMKGILLKAYMVSLVELPLRRINYLQKGLNKGSDSFNKKLVSLVDQFLRRGMYADLLRLQALLDGTCRAFL